MSDEIACSSATRLLELYRSKALSPVEALQTVLARIEQTNPSVNAFCVLDPDRALAQARLSEKRWLRGEPAGLVDGIPVTVKDLVLARDWPTRRGSLTIEPDQAWGEDGPPVARLREAGAVILGKTTTPEFGWKGVTDSALSGITRNPWDPSLTPGGSSGGAAAAAALGMGPLHLATDGGGSIRIPAAFCGVFGFKPTWGLVPVHPHSPALSLWHQGPITRTVQDAALMSAVIARPDARDWYRIPSPGIDFAGAAAGAVAGWRIAYSPDLGYARVDPRVAELTERQLKVFESLGATVEIIDLDLSDPIEIMQPLWSVALALAVDSIAPERQALLEPALVEIARAGFGLSALEYRRLEQRREALARTLCNLCERYDLLVTPQMPITAFAAGHEVPPDTDYRRWWEWSPFTYPFNLSQQPTATVPCGLIDGRPVALQLVGAKFNDAQVLRAAAAFEAAQPWPFPEAFGAPLAQCGTAEPEALLPGRPPAIVRERITGQPAVGS